MVSHIPRHVPSGHIEPPCASAGDICLSRDGGDSGEAAWDPNQMGPALLRLGLVASLATGCKVHATHLGVLPWDSWWGAAGSNEEPWHLPLASYRCRRSGGRCFLGHGGPCACPVSLGKLSRRSPLSWLP